jgi:ATP-dependent DNA helicase
LLAAKRRWSRYENGMNGILADEMGLGKTIQSIGVLAHLWSKEVYGPFLIVGPLTVMTNWYNEFKKFTPDMPCVLYHGSKADRAAIRSQYLKHAGQKTFPIVITTFEIAMIDRKELQRFTWKYLVVDEGHRLKNKDCRLMRELQALKTENRLLLTGTPLQNNLTELWSLLHFTLPAIFQDLETFKNWFNFDEAMGEGGEGQEKIIEDQKEHQLVTKLHAILDPFLLRRLKADVGLSLPKKKEMIIYTSLTKQQKAYYEGLLSKDRSLLEKLQGTLGDAESWSAGGTTQSQSLQNILMQLRKCCNHPFLFQFPMSVNDEPIVDERIVSYCGKLVLLDKMLKHFKANGHKVLIFCQMTKMMDILEDFMELRGYRHPRHPKTPPPTRPCDGSYAPLRLSQVLPH